MSYLLLNFYNNLENSTTDKKYDFYNKSLKEQYERLIARYPQLSKFGFELFIKACFPEHEEKEYFFSIPNFIRENDNENDRDNVEWVKNIVIRASKNSYSQQILPKGLELILIGDIFNMKYGEFIVKGIEFIDGGIYKSGESPLIASPRCGFSKKQVVGSNGVQNFGVDYGLNISHIETALNWDVIDELYEKSYTVSEPQKVIAIYEKWKKYIGFREYYLGVQGQQAIPFDSVSFTKYFTITKKEYNNSPEKFDNYILDDLDQIRKDDPVLLTSQFDNSEPLQCIKVILDKNKKKLFLKTVGNKGLIPEFEQKLKRFTNADICLENEDGKAKIQVEKRLRFYLKDIEPDYSGIEEEYKKQLNKALGDIDNRFNAHLNAQLKTYLERREGELIKKNETELSEYKTKLLKELDTDVAENTDIEISKNYASQIKNKEEQLRKEKNKIKKQIEDRIKTIENDKKKKDKADELQNLHDELAKSMSEFDLGKERQKQTVSLRALYEERNAKLVLKKQASIKTQKEEEIKRNKEDKTREILSSQEQGKTSEKNKARQEYAEKLLQQKAELKDKSTIRRYYIYFKPMFMDNIEEQISKSRPRFFKYDQVPEKAKLDRQKKSLELFFKGYVKNPFLSSYLFAPADIGKTNTDLPDPEYFSQRLNDKQKEAVKKALASESIFLLQGPPGTGKTEVIAEISAQLAKRGKRVLISSETHKAIDNVFERLPKIPEIRPLRLIPNQSKKDESRYSPERLVDNFYINISDRLKKEVEIFRNFSNYKDKFGEEYKKLVLENQKVENEKKRINKVEISLAKAKRERDALVEKQDERNQDLLLLNDKKDEINNFLGKITSFDFTNPEIDYLIKIKEQLLKIIEKHPFIKQEITALSAINKVNIETLKEEVELKKKNPQIVVLNSQKAKIREELFKLKDPETDEILPGKEDEYRKIQKELIAINDSIKKESETNSANKRESIIDRIVVNSKINEEVLASLPYEVRQIKSNINQVLSKKKEELGRDLDAKTDEINNIKSVISELRQQIREKDKETGKTKEEAYYDDYKASESMLKRRITEFFSAFNVTSGYDSIDDALEIIQDQWDDLEHNYSSREKENRYKIPMYERILKFLKSLNLDGSMESDRTAYTKKIFEKANIFGLTCTSRENFKSADMKSFLKYSLEDLDVKRQGIDVVIIDEVSKSSFLDLLIPILYGKTVILVGDHRQLPPMYDLLHIKEDEFEGLDPSIINQKKNMEYAALYEECFFKTLFESVPERLRVTLTKQYRSHGDIMKVFNHFYGDIKQKGSLELGLPNQNDIKQHGLAIKNKSGKSLIEIDKHIYFVDCGDEKDGFEKFEDSTSATNQREANVVIALARKIDEALGNRGGSELDKVRGIDNRLSMGVICTYGDQARLIKKKLRKESLKNISELEEEPFIVSTVDDFQGDERDIIFVSMVRNPPPERRDSSKAQFVKKFERINVALSRARRMLIIVGGKDFLEESVIDLPDMSGNKALDQTAYPIYKKIIETISVYGLILKASDVLAEED